MKTRYFALILGLAFLAIGILGFVPTLRTVESDMPAIDQAQHYGLLFGLFAVNWLHNLGHLAFGAWGVLAYYSFGAARIYAAAVAVVYAVLTVMGLVPGLNVLFGAVPLYGNDVWLHAIIAIVAAVFASQSMTERPGLGLRR